MKNKVIIIGAGIAGLSCAINLANKNFEIQLISNQASERSGSCMAEGGINAALDTYNEGDSIENHFEDTVNNAMGIADEEGIKLLTESAPDIVHWLYELGVQFNLTKDDQIDLRYFGAQKYRRTAYAGDSTGKQMMTALIDETRKYEAKGLINRMNHHSFISLKLNHQKVVGCYIKDDFSNQVIEINAPAIVMATGGYHGIFKNTTGAKVDTGEAVATLFYQGVTMSNLEFIQFHPTTISNGSKRLLITEAARGEGGRLCVLKNGKPYYFMEEKYPDLGNRMPRDITTREMVAQNSPCYLDLTGLDSEIFKHKLNGLKEDCLLYLGLDPCKELIPVKPGIHYFMGGIDVDTKHRTNYEGLYAAGECSACYHGANRVGGNSLLGAAFGGKRVAETIIEEYDYLVSTYKDSKNSTYLDNLESNQERKEIAKILNHALGIIREETTLIKALEELKFYKGPIGLFAQASVQAALNRKESRGAHYRIDFKETKKEFEGATKVSYDGKEIQIEIHHFH